MTLDLLKEIDQHLQGMLLKLIIYTHFDIRKEVANLFENYNLKLLYNSTEKGFSILKNLKDDVIFSIPYELVADTLQRLVFYKAAILSNKDSILLFEEPAVRSRH